MIHTPTPDWRDGMQIHPAAELFPMMADAELDHPARNGRMRQRPWRLVASTRRVLGIPRAITGAPK